MNNKTQNIYNNLSPIEKLKWNLGIGRTLNNLPASKARKEKEEEWH